MGKHPKPALADLLEVQNDFEKPKRTIKHPNGWTPGFEINGDVATLTSEPTTSETPPDEITLIESFALSADDWKIVGKVNCRRWQANVGEGNVEWFYYYKVDLERRNPQQEALFDELFERVQKRRPRKANAVTNGGPEHAYILTLADGQLGKGEGGGVEATLERFFEGLDGVEAHIRELRKSGRNIEEAWVVNAGDLVEGCVGNYPNQQFTVELDYRQQNKLAVAMLDMAVDRIAGLFPKVGVATVPSNHGEHRIGRDAFTNPGDNLDVQMVEQLAFAYSKNPERYGHVGFVIPDQEMSVAFTAANTVVAVSHGHAPKGGGNVENKIVTWWRNQALTDDDMNPLAAANILITGHYHHFRMVEVRKNKWWFQAPSFDGGSKWFKDSTGSDSTPGFMAFTISDKMWSDLRLFTTPY